MFVLGAEIVTIFGSRIVTISAPNTTYTKYANFARLYFPYFTTFRNRPLDEGRCYFAGLKVTKRNQATVLLTLTLFQTPTLTLILTPTLFLT
jgi:hypothetical protein